MPELPEVQTVVSELNRKLKNKTIKMVEVRLGKIVSVGPKTMSNIRVDSPAVILKFKKSLQGQKIKSVTRRAKLLIFELLPTSSLKKRRGKKAGSPSFSKRETEGVHSDENRKDWRKLILLVHLKMTGQFIYLKKNELDKKIRIINKAEAPLYSMPGKHTHAIFTFTDGSKLFYNDLRQFGYLKLVTDKELPLVKELSEFGPEPLDKKFTFEIFKSIIAKRPKAKIKQVLTDQNLIAGIGNIYSDEILFHAKVRPDRKVLRITDRESREIYKQIKKVLKKGIVAHGSSVGDFIRTDGSWGGMGKYHFVYDRSGEKCKVCGSIIKSMKFNGRTGSFCPKCQK